MIKKISKKNLDEFKKDDPQHNDQFTLGALDEHGQLILGVDHPDYDPNWDDWGCNDDCGDLP